MGDDVDTCALWLSSLTSHKLSQAPLSPPKPSQAFGRSQIARHSGAGDGTRLWIYTTFTKYSIF